MWRYAVFRQPSRNFGMMPGKDNKAEINSIAEFYSPVVAKLRDVAEHEKKLRIYSLSHLIAKLLVNGSLLLSIHCVIQFSYPGTKLSGSQ
jgi:hypothetical protein